MNRKSKARILIVDDEMLTREVFRRYLEDEYDVDTAESTNDALDKLSTNIYHIAMTDLVMPGQDGLYLLKAIKQKWPQIAVLVISGRATIEMAVEAMKQGAEDFIEKPVEDFELIKIVIDRILKVRWQTEEIRRLRTMLEKEFISKKIIGNSMAIQKIMEKVKKIAPLETTVLLTGETGVGKELFAELVYNNSLRKNNKFVVVNCGGLPETLLESMLFGHKRGSFTGAVRDKIGYFQEADGGTLFLDEITETSASFQIKLLRVLEKGTIRQVGGDKDIEVNVRIIAATNEDIEANVKKKKFREDLYYRLNVIHIHIPPLRERTEDIILLANSFVKEFAEKHNKKHINLSEPVKSILVTKEWKGNIRELRNAMEHAVALASHNKILPEDLPESVYDYATSNNGMFSGQIIHLPYAEAKETFERHYIIELLKKYGGDVSKAAAYSGIKRQNLYEKFKRYSIDPAEYRE
jgi:DNA-binding NtrC family response regulator